MGDPGGVGPELCIKAVADQRVLNSCNPIIYGDLDLLTRVAGKCGLTMPNHSVIKDHKACSANAIEPGKIRKDCGAAAYTYIESAVRDTLAGRTAAIATAPIHKEALKLAGITEPGHTEILARLTNTKHFCMVMASDEIIVALATIHISIADVPRKLKTENITQAINLTAKLLSFKDIPKPRITVCGLNPHAGEHGMFGDEEERIILPAIKAAETNGISITGPIPPDTAFVLDTLKQTDAYIVMYHDQGLIPFKMIAFDKGVNITLGLPIVRTSADHGTAFDIAWQSKASPESLIQSILWAAKLASFKS